MKSGAAVLFHSDGSPKDIPAKTKPLVSVVIATRNRAPCLPHAIDSIYAQEGLGNLYDIEVIVVDDASTDATSEVIRRYPQLKCIRLSKSRGVSAAVNAGLRACQGSYITFLDDDDEWLPHKLRIQVPALETHPDVGVVYSQSIVRFKGHEVFCPDPSQAPSGRVFQPLLLCNFCGHHASLVVRRSAFDHAGYFDESLISYEDWDLSLRLAFHVAFLFIPGAVDVHNVSPHGLWQSRDASGAGSEDAKRVIEKNLRMLPEEPSYEQLKRKARARNEFETAPRIADPTQAWAKVVAALREYPEVASDAWSQARATEVLHRLISDSRTSNRDGLCAAAYAFANQASCRTQKLLLQAIVRSILGHRAYTACMTLYRSLNRKVKRVELLAAKGSQAG
jgi:glycosyltransferase involved in cell wall biosynthesis